MATPDEQAELSRARQGLATTSRSLRDTRETVNNIIPDDEDDTNQLLADLAAKGKDLLAQVNFPQRRNKSHFPARGGSLCEPFRADFSRASVTKLCLPQLCEPSDLQSHYEAIEHTLVEAGVKQIDDFLEAASEVFHIFVDIFPKDLAERQALTRQMLSKLPQTIIEQVVDRIRHMAGITSPGEDWGTALPFDEALDGVSSVCEVIRLVCRTKDEAITCDSHEDTDDDTNPVKQADSVAAVAQCQATYRPEVDYSGGVVRTLYGRTTDKVARVRKSSHGKTLQQKQQINEGIDKLLSSGFVGYI
ncbi:hypothetical protein FOZ62_028108, partial [Perkinsus olseni]